MDLNLDRDRLDRMEKMNAEIGNLTGAEIAKCWRKRLGDNADRYADEELIDAVWTVWSRKKAEARAIRAELESL
jgi:hypothetical protein